MRILLMTIGAVLMAAASAAPTAAMLTVATAAHVEPLAPSAPAVEACPANAKKANLGFTLKNTEGQTINLASYKGKVLLLDFWATWCAPCKVEMPGFIDLYKTYRSRGFEVVGVVAMDEFSKAKPFATQFGINYPVLNGVDREDIEDAFGPFFALPTTLLIARDGRICSRHVGLPPATGGGTPGVDAIKKVFEAQIKALL
jgi:peroxiredoxin